MSLEEALKANTAAVLAQNALLEKIAGTKPAGTAAGTKPAGAVAGTKPAGARPTTKPKAEPTVDDVAAKVTEFLKVGDKALRDQRKAEVKTIIDHYGVDRVTNVDPASFAEVLSFVKAYEDGEVPDFGDGDGDGGSDDDMV